MSNPFEIEIPIYHDFLSFTCQHCGEEYYEEDEQYCIHCETDEVIWWCCLCGDGFEYDERYEPDCDQALIDESDRYTTITYAYAMMQESRMKLHREFNHRLVEKANVGLPEDITLIIAEYM